MKRKYKVAAILLSIVACNVALAEDVKVTTKGGLKVESGEYKFQFGGRIMYDFNRSELNNVVDEDDFDLRRGRVFAKGDIGDNWSFKTQFNIDGGGTEDIYLRYKGWGKGANLTIGKQKMPFGLEELTSSKDISVLERSAITERYALGRQEGIQLHGGFGNQTYALAVFNDEGDDEEGILEDTGYAARYTIAPIHTDSSLFHFGIAYKDLRDDTAIGLEAAYVYGPFHIQAEWVDGEEGDTDIDGYYIQAGYILTGESRPYKGGKFKRVKAKNSGGAWEIVARYENGDGNHSDIELGSTDAVAYTIGVNWYSSNNNVRLGVNYTNGESNVNSDEGNEFRARFQLTF